MKKNIKLNLDVYTAIVIRQCLDDAQKGHSFDFPSERIINIRQTIQELNSEIKKHS
jgi:hypothetical protein